MKKRLLCLLLCLGVCTHFVTAYAENMEAVQDVSKLTRGEFINTLWQEAGAPEPSISTSTFSDVTAADSYFKAVLWASEWGITKGTSQTTFHPADECSAEQIALFNTRVTEKNLLEKAYIFTLPIMMMDATFTKMTNTVKATSEQAPVNQLVHAQALATAKFKDVVTPNVDTIYSQIFFKLNENAVILEMPKTDRFCTVQVIDAYTNCVTVLDCSEFENENQKFIFTTESFTGEIPEDMTEVKSPTSLVWLIIRTLCYDKADEANVHDIQSRMKSYTYTQYKENTIDEVPDGVFDENNNFVPSTHVLTMNINDYFARANLLMAENPPAKEDETILNEIAKINIGPNLAYGTYEFSADIDKMWQKIVSGAVESTTAQSNKFLTINGTWFYMGYPIAEFGTEYAYRALISIVGLGANPVSVAVYPKAQTDADGNRLNGNNSYVLHFDKDQLPPVEGNGFWSVTAYTSKDNFLIDNEIDRYCINNRSDVTFNEDGSLDILIQSDKPDTNTTNWLPVVPEDFHLILRVYRPDESVVSGQWKTPVIYKKAD